MAWPRRLEFCLRNIPGGIHMHANNNPYYSVDGVERFVWSLRQDLLQHFTARRRIAGELRRVCRGNVLRAQFGGRGGRGRNLLHRGPGGILYCWWDRESLLGGVVRGFRNWRRGSRRGCGGRRSGFLMPQEFWKRKEGGNNANPGEERNSVIGKHKRFLGRGACALA